MADAMEMMILAILSPALHCEWQLQGWQEALITTVSVSILRRWCEAIFVLTAAGVHQLQCLVGQMLQSMIMYVFQHLFHTIWHTNTHHYFS